MDEKIFSAKLSLSSSIIMLSIDPLHTAAVQEQDGSSRSAHTVRCWHVHTDLRHHHTVTALDA